MSDHETGDTQFAEAVHRLAAMPPDQAKTELLSMDLDELEHVMEALKWAVARLEYEDQWQRGQRPEQPPLPPA
jgi:hypothetical protein